jgi:hypothetical protein
MFGGSRWTEDAQYNYYEEEWRHNECFLPQYSYPTDI